MSARITIRIETGGAAFDNNNMGEVARILRDLADRAERDGIEHGRIMDANGHTCGQVLVQHRSAPHE